VRPRAGGLILHPCAARLFHFGTWLSAHDHPGVAARAMAPPPDNHAASHPTSVV